MLFSLIAANTMTLGKRFARESSHLGGLFYSRGIGLVECKSIATSAT